MIVLMDSCQVGMSNNAREVNQVLTCVQLVAQVCLSGDWLITDTRGQNFDYQWFHQSGQPEFSGIQLVSGKPKYRVWGTIRQSAVEWLCGQSLGPSRSGAVLCKGSLSADCSKIIDGAYSRSDSGEQLGQFTGECTNKYEVQM